MRAIIIMIGLMMPFREAVAGRSSTTLSIGVMVVAACPTGGEGTCRQAAAASPETEDVQAVQARDQPIAILRDQRLRTVTIVY